MQKGYRILWMGFLVLLLGGCSKGITSTESFAKTIFPTEPVAASIPAEVILSSGMQSMLLEGKLIHDMRVIPADLDPATRFNTVLSHYKTALNDDSQHLRWILGAYTVTMNFYLLLTSQATAANETVRMVFPLEIIISRTAVSPVNMNFIAPLFGGGGGALVSFPSFRLTPGRFLLQPIDPQNAAFSFQTMPDILYDMSVQCIQPGVFNIHINQTYTLTTNGATSYQLMPYDILVACPQTATVWIFNPTTDALDSTQQVIFNSGQFDYQP
jgi:hypothetical protein